MKLAQVSFWAILVICYHGLYAQNCSNLTFSITQTDAFCYGVCNGSATVTVSGGTQPYTYFWSNGDASANPATLCSGIQSVTVTDDSGCIVVDSVLIGQPAPTFSTISVIICQGDSIFIGGHWIKNVAGMFLDTLTTLNGCDSLVAINLSIMVTDRVWPGDANNDLIANNNDLLPLGLYYGETGIDRASISNQWVGQCSEDWNTFQLNGSNKKHVDCNGDGVINDSDTLAINLNYGLTHAKGEGSPAPAIGPILALVPRSSIYQPGDTVILDIVLGDNSTSVSELYGIAFNLSFDNSMAEPGTVQLSYTNSWLGNIANNLKLSKIFESSGKADGALTRTDHQNASGYGAIGVLQFIANSNINSLQSSTVSITNYEAVKANGDAVLFDAQDATFTIDGTSGINIPNSIAAFRIYPNPFTSSTTIEFSLKQDSEVTLKVYDVVGRVVFESASSQKSKGIHHIQFENSASGRGLFIVELNVDGVKIRKRMMQIL